jgi:hypothetical protein
MKLKFSKKFLFQKLTILVYINCFINFGKYYIIILKLLMFFIF